MIPEEPTGLGAVVRAECDCSPIPGMLIRIHHGWWCCRSGDDHRWQDLNDPQVLALGYEDPRAVTA